MDWVRIVDHVHITTMKRSGLAHPIVLYNAHCVRCSKIESVFKSKILNLSEDCVTSRFPLFKIQGGGICRTSISQRVCFEAYLALHLCMRHTCKAKVR